MSEHIHWQSRTRSWKVQSKLVVADFKQGHPKTCFLFNEITTSYLACLVERYVGWKRNRYLLTLIPHMMTVNIINVNMTMTLIDKINVAVRIYKNVSFCIWHKEIKTYKANLIFLVSALRWHLIAPFCMILHAMCQEGLQEQY